MGPDRANRNDDDVHDKGSQWRPWEQGIEICGMDQGNGYRVIAS